MATLRSCINSALLILGCRNVGRSNRHSYTIWCFLLWHGFCTFSNTLSNNYSVISAIISTLWKGKMSNGVKENRLKSETWQYYNDKRINADRLLLLLRIILRHRNNKNEKLKWDLRIDRLWADLLIIHLNAFYLSGLAHALYFRE